MQDDELSKAFKKAIKLYWSDEDEELDEATTKPKKYDKKYFLEREKEYLGEKKDED